MKRHKFLSDDVKYDYVKSYYVNKDGEKAFDYNFTFHVMNEDITFDFNENYALINANAKLLSDYEYSRVYPFSEGRAFVCKNDTFGFVNRKNEFLFKRPGYTPSSWMNIETIEYSHGLATLGKHYNRGVINFENDTVIDFKYYDASHFYNGFSIVTLIIDSKIRYSIIDRRGNYLFEWYNKLSNHGKDLRVGKQINGVQNWAILSTENKTISEWVIGYDSMYESNYFSGIRNNKMEAFTPNGQLVNDKDSTLKLLDSFFDFNNGLATYKLQKNGVFLYGVIDEKGNIITPALYKNISKFEGGLSIYEKYNDKENWSVIVNTECAEISDRFNSIEKLDERYFLAGRETN